jgi:hypothetical protein
LAWRWKISTMTPVRSSTCGAGRPLQVADLARREFVIDDHEFAGCRASSGAGRSFVGGALEALPRLGVGGGAMERPRRCRR